MKRKLSLLTAAFIIIGQMLFIPVKAYENKPLPSSTMSNELGGKIDEYVEKNKDNMAGMGVAVFDKNDVICEKYFGYADKETGKTVDKDTVFEWGSATKVLVWISIMQQVEKGKLDLDADIKQYLPDGYMKNLKYSEKITLKNLMNHNAGFQEMYFDVFNKDRATILSLEAQLAKFEPTQVRKPGDTVAYSNWGVALGALIVERITGEEFYSYVHKNIFAPLNMNKTAVNADLSDNSWVQEKRKELECYTQKGSLISDCFYYIALYPAGMCTSTLEDFRILVCAMASKNEKILSPQSWEEFFSPTLYYTDTDIPRNCHGMWTVLRNDVLVSHGGNTAGCSSYFYIEPKSGIGAVVMTNQQGEMKFNTEMMDLVFGKENQEKYFGEQTNPPGVYKVARNISTGPLKILSASYMGGFEKNIQYVWHYVPGKDGREAKVEMGVMDVNGISTGNMVFEVIVLFLGVFGIWVAVLTLLVKAIRWIVYKIRKKENNIYLSKWALIYSITVVALVCSLIYIVYGISSFQAYKSYGFLIYALLLIMIGFVALFLYGVGKVFKGECSKKRKFVNGVILLSQLFMIVFMGYFEMWKFWVK